MADITNYNGLSYSNEIVSKSKTITQLIVEHKLSFPFIIQKTTPYLDTMGGLYMQQGTILTVDSKLSNLNWSNEKNERKYLCYADGHPLKVTDSPSWMLVEKSGDNVLSFNACKKFKESKKLRIK